MSVAVGHDRPAHATPVGPLKAPGLDFVFRAIVDIGSPIELGRIDGVRKRVIPILGGSFAGPAINGTVLEGGADWQSVRDDGTADIAARYTLRAGDGTVIAVANPGFRHGPPEILARLARGDDVDPATYYFRTTPRFDVFDGPHGWLGRNVFVGTAARQATRVIIDVFLVN